MLVVDQPHVADQPDAQRMRALVRANEIRSARAQLRRDVRDGRRTVRDVLFDPPDEAHTMPVGELLLAQHRWGRTRVRRALAAVPVAENKPLKALTDRQRLVLAGLVAR